MLHRIIGPNKQTFTSRSRIRRERNFLMLYIYRLLLTYSQYFKVMKTHFDVERVISIQNNKRGGLRENSLERRLKYIYIYFNGEFACKLHNLIFCWCERSFQPKILRIDHYAVVSSLSGSGRKSDGQATPQQSSSVLPRTGPARHI